VLINVVTDEVQQHVSHVLALGEPFSHSRSVPVGPAQRRELPATYLALEPKPILAYDDNPVFNEIGAAQLIGVTADCLKKWRHRKQGPDYIQYGSNGPVRYELKALMEFRDKYRVRLAGLK
jgi:hypothetical protein